MCKSSCKVVQRLQTFRLAKVNFSKYVDTQGGECAILIIPCPLCSPLVLLISEAVGIPASPAMTYNYMEKEARGKTHVLLSTDCY